jgi:RNA polymerase sigma-70 factor (ECF subfamily)
LAIASHYCIDRLRRRRFSLVSWDDLPPWRWLPDSHPQPEEIAIRHEAQRNVQRLLEKLPPDYKAAIILRYWHELSYEEIAEALDSTLPAIKSRLYRARQMMAQAAIQAETTPTLDQPVFANGVEALQSAPSLRG